MQTKLTDPIQASREGQTAGEIIGKCVHCGFCNATRPTYQLLSDELDEPRGRVCYDCPGKYRLHCAFTIQDHNTRGALNRAA